MWVAWQNVHENDYMQSRKNPYKQASFHVFKDGVKLQLFPNETALRSGLKGFRPGESAPSKHFKRLRAFC